MQYFRTSKVVAFPVLPGQAAERARAWRPRARPEPGYRAVVGNRPRSTADFAADAVRRRDASSGRSAARRPNAAGHEYAIFARRETISPSRIARASQSPAGRLPRSAVLDT